MVSTARDLDQFYTNVDVAQHLVQKVISVMDHISDPPRFWLEPSAGSGSFFHCLPDPKIGVDIDPRCSGVIGADFLQWAPPPLRPIWAVGNPPFGKNASLAIRFFNHAATFCSLIAFVVPRTFEKRSVQAKLDRSFHLIEEIPLLPASFVFEERPYSVPCVFQIWQKRFTFRVMEPLQHTHPDFLFTSKIEADFSFQRVGVRAGVTSRDFLYKADQSHYFIKDMTSSKNVQFLLDRVDWSPIKQRTAGNPSIGKAELVEEYVRILKCVKYMDSSQKS